MIRPARSPAAVFQNQRFRIVRYALALASVALIAFLGLRASPFMREISWLPPWVATWADRHWVLRSFVGFFLLGLVWFSLVRRGWRHVGALCGFATAVEVVQLWIPRRVYDWRDIAASILGVLAAWAIVAMSVTTKRTMAAKRKNS